MLREVGEYYEEVEIEPSKYHNLVLSETLEELERLKNSRKISPKNVKRRTCRVSEEEETDSKAPVHSVMDSAMNSAKQLNHAGIPHKAPGCLGPTPGKISKGGAPYPRRSFDGVVKLDLTEEPYKEPRHRTITNWHRKKISKTTSLLINNSNEKVLYYLEKMDVKQKLESDTSTAIGLKKDGVDVDWRRAGKYEDKGIRVADDSVEKNGEERIYMAEGYTYRLTIKSCDGLRWYGRRIEMQPGKVYEVGKTFFVDPPPHHHPTNWLKGVVIISACCFICILCAMIALYQGHH
ncbi:unnamed protein product [Chrysoparadoxa australica]